MSKWFSLTIALVVIAASSTASAEVIKRFGRLVAEEQAASEPQPAAEAAPEAAPEMAVEEPVLDAPVPDVVYGKGTEIKGGSCCGSTSYGYPFVDGCCTSSYYGSGLWTGYYGRQCGLGCLHRGRCCGAGRPPATPQPCNIVIPVPSSRAAADCSLACMPATPACAAAKAQLAAIPAADTALDTAPA